MVGEERPAAPTDPAPSDAPSPVDGADEALPAGTLLGKYDIVEVLGQGGFGITYRARDSRLDREVAIKEYLPTSFARRHGSTTVLPRSTRTAEDFLWGRERFLDEAKTLARLENTVGIVNVYDYLEANGTAYMVMALVRGETLEARLKRSGRLPQPAIEQFFYPLLDGLEWVHQTGFLHRDIKPANILLDVEGRPTLIDFGASRLALQGRTKAMTAVYTPGYAAYEQATSAPQGPWTDIYALAATIYQCVTGAPPPSALERMSDDTLVPAAEAGKARYAPSLLAAIDAGLKLKAADRPQSIADWRRVMAGLPITAPTDAMTRPMEGPLTAAPSQVASPPARRRKGRVWIAAGAVVLMVATGGGWLAYDSHRRAEAEAARKVAEEKAATEEAARKAAEAETRRRAEAAEATLRLTERDRYQVRLALTSLGFDAGSGDGAFGTRSRPMIAAWQKSRGFPDTGYLTGPQLAALRAQAAEALARDDERLKRQEETKRKAEQEAAARKAAEEKAAADAVARKAAEERAAAETARKAAEDKAAAEAAARRKAEQETAARKVAEEKAAAEAAARKAAEEKAAAERRKAQEAAWRAAAEESGRRAEEQARAEDARRQAAEEKAAAEAAAKRKAEQEAAARKAAEEKAAAEVAAKRKAEEDARAADKAQAGARRQQAEAVEAALGLNERDRRQVRVALKSLGFDGGLGDAPFGDRSRPMIAAWQKSRGFDDTGYLTGPQLAALRQQAAPAIARDEEEQKRLLEAKRKAEEEAKRQAPPPAGGDLLGGWVGFQGCLVSSGGFISGGGTRYNVVARKVCFSAAGGRYEVTLDNGMVCSAAARKIASPVGFSVERQTCTAPTSGNPQFTWINTFEAPCVAGTTTGTLACRTNYANGSSGGPYVFRRQ